MKKRDRRKHHRTTHHTAVKVAPAPAAAAGRSWERGGWWAAGILVAALAVTLAYRMWPADAPPEPLVPVKLVESPGNPPPNRGHGPFSRGSAPPAKTKKAEVRSFLEEFDEGDPKTDKEPDSPAPASADLEKHFKTLASISDRLSELDRRALVPGALPTELSLEKAQASRKGLIEELDEHAASLQKELAQARRARPDDAVPRWLTGELLMLVGGEPEEILPHLEFAVQRGLKRLRLLGSMALTQLEANRFGEAYRLADDALDSASQDRYLWKAFGRAAFSSNRFEVVRDRLARAFADGLPDWAKAIRKKAEELQAQWDAEETLRQAEKKADDLPRVRLTIEHRRFARDASGKPLTTIESSGREDVVLELFENEAPQTVASFIELASQKFYDGTRFHLALPTIMAAGGDPNSKSTDPAEDGAGGPGYVIADEYRMPRARKHFRGSISMVNTGAHTTGSQFFICLSPAPEMNGNFTVFGRVIEGQEVVDRITRGRTTRDLGHYGKIIPGDLVVHAEVLRKRAHEYRAARQ
jgi:cyclophilin family peptidyl-prolyl cis-trans isomerase